MNRLTTHIAYPKVAPKEPPPKRVRKGQKQRAYVPRPDIQYRAWDQSQLDMLMALVSRTPRPSDMEIAEILGRTDSAIKSKLASLRGTR